MRLRYEVKDANGMTIGAATSQAGAVAVAQQVQGAAYIYHAKTAHSFWLDCPERGYLAGAAARSPGVGTRAALFDHYWLVARCSTRAQAEQGHKHALQASRLEHCPNDWRTQSTIGNFQR